MCFREVLTGTTNLLNCITQPINKIILNNFLLEETIILKDEFIFSKLEVIEFNSCQMNEETLILLLGKLFITSLASL